MCTLNLNAGDICADLILKYTVQNRSETLTNMFLSLLMVFDRDYSETSTEVIHLGFCYYLANFRNYDWINKKVWNRLRSDFPPELIVLFLFLWKGKKKLL